MSPIRSGHRHTNTTQCVATIEPRRGLAHLGQRSMPNGIRSGLDVHTSRKGPSLVSSVDEFEVLFRDGVRQTRRSAIGLNQKQHRVLDDVSRGVGIRMVAQVLDIARWQCACPADATAIPEVCRGYVLAGHPTNWSVFAASQTETDANCDFDQSQIAYAMDPSPANYERLVESGNRQLAETRRVMDAAHFEQRGRR